MESDERKQKEETIKYHESRLRDIKSQIKLLEKVLNTVPKEFELEYNKELKELYKVKNMYDHNLKILNMFDH